MRTILEILIKKFKTDDYINNKILIKYVNKVFKMLLNFVGDSINLPATINNDDLKDKLSELFLEYEELINHIGPTIEQRYVSLFGFLEIEAYRLEIKIDKLKKKIQLIQIEINQKNEVNMEKINDHLDRIFKEFDEKLKQQEDDFNNTIAQEGKFLSKEEAKELKDKYRTIIKKLHPDLKEEVSESEKTLFNQATLAFDLGDLDTIRVIYSVIDEDVEDDDLNMDFLEKQISNIEEKIREYKKEYPYNKKEIIENQERINEYTTFLKDLVKSYKEEIKHLEKRLEEMILDVS